VPATVRAETAPVAAVNTADGVALKGYDAVAYFIIGSQLRACPNTRTAGRA